MHFLEGCAMMDDLIWCSYVQYKLDFTGLSAGGGAGTSRAGSTRDEEAAGGGGGDAKPGGSTSDTAMWQYGMGRRGKGDARRTRVSFLLF